MLANTGKNYLIGLLLALCNSITGEEDHSIKILNKSEKCHLVGWPLGLQKFSYEYNPNEWLVYIGSFIDCVSAVNGEISTLNNQLILYHKQTKTLIEALVSRLQGEQDHDEAYQNLDLPIQQRPIDDLRKDALDALRIAIDAGSVPFEQRLMKFLKRESSDGQVFSEEPQGRDTNEASVAQRVSLRQSMTEEELEQRKAHLRKRMEERKAKSAASSTDISSDLSSVRSGILQLIEKRKQSIKSNSDASVASKLVGVDDSHETKDQTYPTLSISVPSNRQSESATSEDFEPAYTQLPTSPINVEFQKQPSACLFRSVEELSEESEDSCGESTGSSLEYKESDDEDDAESQGKESEGNSVDANSSDDGSEVSRSESKETCSLDDDQQKFEDDSQCNNRDSSYWGSIAMELGGIMHNDQPGSQSGESTEHYQRLALDCTLEALDGVETTLECETPISSDSSSPCRETQRSHSPILDTLRGDVDYINRAKAALLIQSHVRARLNFQTTRLKSIRLRADILRYEHTAKRILRFWRYQKRRKKWEQYWEKNKEYSRWFQLTRLRGNGSITRRTNNDKYEKAIRCIQRFCKRFKPLREHRALKQSQLMKWRRKRRTLFEEARKQFKAIDKKCSTAFEKETRIREFILKNQILKSHVMTEFRRQFSQWSRRMRHEILKERLAPHWIITVESDEQVDANKPPEPSSAGARFFNMKTGKAQATNPNEVKVKRLKKEQHIRGKQQVTVALSKITNVQRSMFALLCHERNRSLRTLNNVREAYYKLLTRKANTHKDQNSRGEVDQVSSDSYPATSPVDFVVAGYYMPSAEEAVVAESPLESTGSGRSSPMHLSDKQLYQTSQLTPKLHRREMIKEAKRHNQYLRQIGESPKPRRKNNGTISKSPIAKRKVEFNVQYDPDNEEQTDPSAQPSGQARLSTNKEKFAAFSTNHRRRLNELLASGLASSLQPKRTTSYSK